MKKKLVGIILLSSLVFVGCGNKQLIDTKWNFKKAIIFVGDESVEVEVRSWKDYETDTTIQITDTNGVTYLTDLTNVVLIDE